MGAAHRIAVKGKFKGGEWFYLHHKGDWYVFVEGVMGEKKLKVETPIDDPKDITELDLGKHGKITDIDIVIDLSKHHKRLK